MEKWIDFSKITAQITVVLLHVAGLYVFVPSLYGISLISGIILGLSLLFAAIISKIP